MITWSPFFLLMTLASTYLISEAYRKTKISLKHKSELGLKFFTKFYFISLKDFSSS